MLENNGKLSIFTDNDIYPMPIILDGVIEYDTIKSMNKNVDWVEGLYYASPLSHLFLMTTMKDMHTENIYSNYSHVTYGSTKFREI